LLVIAAKPLFPIADISDLRSRFRIWSGFFYAQL